ncbi:cobW-domain-containing protein [Clavulina sp. PMI_390]|nr:cobW-domain-containing protein [Clavulina sp. PMI_390]
MATLKPIPITVFTGFLGSGKTSIILSLLPQLPSDYKVVLLKNEFGDVEVDSQLAKQSSLAAVSEILNGCMCCVLVGQMKTAILEIREKFRPDRIIIESSGSAFPATLAFQIRELERETTGDLKLDAIVTVIDAENFVGYEDTSTTAKMQAQYSDILLINKWEHVSMRQLDIVMDHLFTLNELTPKIKCIGRNGVDPSLLFGIDSKLFQSPDDHSTHGTGDSDHHHHHQEDGSQHDEVEVATILAREDSPSSSATITRDALDKALATLPKDVIYRVKGYVPLAPSTASTPMSSPEVVILNWAFGRIEITPHVSASQDSPSQLRLSVMGERGEVKRKWAVRLADALGGVVV